MKKIVALFIMSLVLAACAKELPFTEEPLSTDAISVPARFTAGFYEDSKLMLDGLRFNWETGDIVVGRCPSAATWTSESNCDSLIAVSSGNTSAFEGNVRYVPEKTLYFFYGRDGKFNGTQSSQFIKTISSTQSGKQDAVRDNALLWCMVKDAKLEDGVLRFSATLKSHFSVLKLNLPASLDVRSIEVSGNNLCGTVTVSSPKTWGTIGAPSSNFSRLSDAGSTITVGDGSSILSGDILIPVAACDAFDSEKNQYYNSSESLKFVFTTGSGSRSTVQKTLQGHIYNSSLKNLGQVKSLKYENPPVNPGKLVVLDRADGLYLSVADPDPNCTYHYEISSGAEVSAPDPTVSSAEFDPSEGFPVSTISPYTERYVKVLAHTLNPQHYSDAILKGNIRNWNLVNGCAIFEAYKKFLADKGQSNLLPKDSFSAEGLRVYHSSSSVERIEPSSTGAILNTARTSYEPITKFSSHAYLYQRFKRTASLSWRFVKGDYTSIDDTTTPSGDPADPYAFVFDCGNVSPGDMYAIRHNGATTNYAVAYLETGDSVDYTGEQPDDPDSYNTAKHLWAQWNITSSVRSSSWEKWRDENVLYASAGGYASKAFITTTAGTVSTKPVTGRGTDGSGNELTVSNLVPGDAIEFHFPSGNLKAGASVDFMITASASSSAPKYYIFEYWESGEWKVVEEDLKTASDIPGLKYSFHFESGIPAAFIQSFLTKDITRGEVKVRLRVVGNRTVNGKSLEANPNALFKLENGVNNYVACGMDIYQGIPIKASKKVLMTGNSWTYYNASYYQLKQLARWHGYDLRLRVSVKGDSRVQDHLNLPGTSIGGFKYTLEQIRDGGFDYALIQEMSANVYQYYDNARPEEPEMIKSIMDSVRRYSPSCQCVLEDNWARPANNFNGYGSFAEQHKHVVGGALGLCEYVSGISDYKVWMNLVGMAFKASYESGFTDLYNTADMSHPSKEGSYLKACSLYLMLFGGTLASDLPDYILSTSNAAKMRVFATQACSPEFRSLAMDPKLSDLEKYL